MKSGLNKERLYENLLASIEEGVIVLGTDYSIITFNQGAEGLTGVSEGQAKYTSVYNGTKFYFCSAACKQQFEKNPTKYAR